MRRVEKQIAALERVDLAAALHMAQKAGYHVEVYDGDVETGPLPPEIVAIYRPDAWAREVERRIMREVERNY